MKKLILAIGVLFGFFSAASAANSGFLFYPSSTSIVGELRGDGSFLTGVIGTNGGVTTGNINVSQIDAQTEYLLHLDGANGSQVLVDEKGHTATVGGAGVTLSDTDPKFGSASLHCDGTVDIPVSLSNASDANFGTGDFTVESWVKIDSLKDEAIFSKTNYDDGWYLMFSNYLSNHFNLFLGAQQYGPEWTPILGRWYHIAVTRASNHWYLFVDGVSIFDVVDAATYDSTSPLLIGGSPIAPGWGLDGYFDEFRVSKGVARWTSNFTPQPMAYSSAIISLGANGTVSAAHFSGILVSSQSVPMDFTGSTTELKMAHGFGAIPTEVGASFVCVNSTDGYTAGDELDAIDVSAVTVWRNATEVGISAAGIDLPYISRSDYSTNVQTSARAGDWKIILRAWK